ncbi:MAG: glycerol-3-phosphate dehydrogenase/oxidase [Phycisphaerales bacterium]|nr:glycerol-3-phosphate dehydrogenase/oxidase [Phycisphaerales bacterium]
MRRENHLAAASSGEPWDIVIIGGGATGLGCAVDAASRGCRTLLLEQVDWAKATSSRSTKLVHGGVRYLQQGNISLVREALHERGIMAANAPHLVRNLAFIVPRYKWWEGPFYGIGLKLYDLLAGRLNLAPSRILGHDKTLEAIPNLEPSGLDGGVEYHDGQFDDARMCVTLMRTAQDHGAAVLNHATVTGLTHDADGHVCGLTFRDEETGQEVQVSASAVVNATGVFSNDIRRMDDDAVESIVEPSRGVHLVLDASFLRGDTAIMVPHTDDGRILFVIPWHGRCLVGTTDAHAPEPCLEPRATDEEVEFILRNAARYLDRDPGRGDVLSVFAGLRPLVRKPGTQTKKISREHEVIVDPSGLVTVVGGKWTTYRKMAMDTIDHAIDVAALDHRPCVTADLKLRGWMAVEDSTARLDDWRHFYGTDLDEVEAICAEVERGNELLDEGLPYPRGLVVHAVRHEHARTVEDVLARRMRALLLDAHASARCARQVADLIAAELGRDEAWCAAQTASYEALAAGYVLDD